MFRSFSRLCFVLPAALAVFATVTPAQTRTGAVILSRIDERRLVSLGGNTRPEATAENDAGEVPAGLRMEHMMLQLRRPAAREAALIQLIDDLHDPKSSNFHKWLTADNFGREFGLAETDRRTLVTWLESHGFTVNSVYPNGVVIDFSGTAGQVKETFHTSVHHLNVNGVRHIANLSNPQIPEALGPAIAGIASLHDFFPQKMTRARTGKAITAKAAGKRGARPDYDGTYDGQAFEAVVPADLATIYDFNPLFAQGITGSGQTVVVIEDTNLYRTSDWNTFRTAFDLSQYTSGSLSTQHPAPASGTTNCFSPGITSDDSEAILDAEWASAAAPGAAIVVASCANTGVTSGLFIAAQNLVNASAPPSIVSISYGQCEAENGAAMNASLNSLFQQAVAEGVSIFVAAGDEGAASCDAGMNSASHGIGVSAFASTPYNVAVGGTDFSDIYSGTESTYWNPRNSPGYGSAISYIPEIPWNDSCAGSLLALSFGYPTTYGSGGFCTSAIARTDGFLVVAGGSGGPSNCATGVPSTFGVASGTCQGYAKPSWQTALSGIPNDGVRDIPDVSMFASDGAAWGHYSVVCFTDESNGGAPCSGPPENWAGFGGTSIAAPEMAGIQALINQNTGKRQGNPNYVYYQMALSTPSAFHTVTQGDIDMNCNGTANCYGFLGNVDYGRDGRVFGTTYGGALSTSDGSFAPAYAAGTAWNFANGIGSVDAYNLVTNWP